MTVQISLPQDVERRLMAEVKTGRHRSLEEAILERLARNDEPDLLAVSGMTADDLRRDLDDAWQNRRETVDGDAVFERIAAKSKASQPQCQ